MGNLIQELKILSGKKFVRLTFRGNASIDLILELAKKHNRNTVIIPDQGGWIHYKMGPKKKKMAVVEVKTNSGLIGLEDLKKKAGSNSILLSCSMPGYFAMDDVKLIYEICKEKNCWFVNDASGSIGTDAAKVGDFVLCSFGEDKPINAGYGGFISTDDESLFNDMGDAEFDLSKSEKILSEIKKLPEKLKEFRKIRQKIIADLKEFDIIYPEKNGIDVVVRFSDDAEKEKITKYCAENKLEFTLCPRYIRVNENAVSIEVKRLI